MNQNKECLTCYMNKECPGLHASRWTFENFCMVREAIENGDPLPELKRSKKPIIFKEPARDIIRTVTGILKEDPSAPLN